MYAHVIHAAVRTEHLVSYTHVGLITSYQHDSCLHHYNYRLVKEFNTFIAVYNNFAMSVSTVLVCNHYT